MSVIKGIGRNDELPSVTVSPANFASFVTKLLTERQHKVEVWSENKSARGGWAVSKRGSPGNLESFEDVIFDTPGETQDTPTALCIQVGRLKCHMMILPPKAETLVYVGKHFAILRVAGGKDDGKNSDTPATQYMALKLDP
jgi:hypothetical protein